MHVMIINGSPRVEKYSNTDKIIDSFAEGLAEAGATFEKHAVSRKESWPVIREAYTVNREIVIAMPWNFWKHCRSKTKLRECLLSCREDLRKQASSNVGRRFWKSFRIIWE